MFMGERRKAWRCALACLAIAMAAAFYESGTPWHRHAYVSYETLRMGKTDMKFPVYHFAPRLDPKAPSGVYVPLDIEDAIRELNRMLPHGLIEEMRAGSQWQMLRYHLSVGMWIRNNWGLWQGSRLQDYFTSRGVFHPDDMSSIILNSYWQWLQSQSSKSGNRKSRPTRTAGSGEFYRSGFFSRDYGNRQISGYVEIG